MEASVNKYCSKGYGMYYSLTGCISVTVPFTYSDKFRGLHFDFETIGEALSFVKGIETLRELQGGSE